MDYPWPSFHSNGQGAKVRRTGNTHLYRTAIQMAIDESTEPVTTELKGSETVVCPRFPCPETVVCPRFPCPRFPEPQTNGVAERFNRTLKEQVIHGRVLRNLEEVRGVVTEFKERYNRHWRLEKLGFLSPLEARQAYTLQEAA